MPPAHPSSTDTPGAGATGAGPSAGYHPSQRHLERIAYRRSRTRRSLAIAAVSTVVVVGAIVAVVGSSSGWPRFRNSFLDLSVGWHDLPALFGGLWTNVQIMLISEVCILVLASLVAVMRTLQGPVFLPLRAFAAFYTDVFRGLPLLIVLLLVGYGLPSLRLAGIPQSEFVLGIVSLVLTYTAYVAEVLRAGIESIHPSQRASARALGLTYSQTMRHVVFPQAVRRVMPALLNDFVSLQKDSSLVYVLSVSEMVLVAQNQSLYDFKFVHLVFAGLIFVLLTIPLTRLTDWYARRNGWFGAGGVL